MTGPLVQKFLESSERAMKEQMELLISQETGHPCACIPNALVWDLVEYLSVQRVRASYDFDANQFKVSFPGMSIERAQALLNEWLAVETLAHAEGGS